jgi:hypothetical protein
VWASGTLLYLASGLLDFFTLRDESHHHLHLQQAIWKTSGFDLLSEPVACRVLACDNPRDKRAVPKPIFERVFIGPIRSEMKNTPVIY